MPEIHIFGNRLYAAGRKPGLIITRDQLALLDETSVAAVTSGAVVGPQSYQDAGSLSMTNDGRLRVDTSPTIETVNLFASPSPWSGGSPWSAQSPW